MAVEIAGAEMFFQSISRTGQTVDSGVIRRQDRTSERRHLATRSRWRAAVPRLSRFAVEHLLLLPLGAAIALVWANTAPESYYRFIYTIAFAVNDVAMMFFFGLVTKEVVEATAPGGVLHPWRRALLPVIAAIGATLLPALIYIRAVDLLDEPVLAIGWPVTSPPTSPSAISSRESFSGGTRWCRSSCSGDRLRRARVPGARARQSSRRSASRSGRADHGRGARMAFGLRRARVKASGRMSPPAACHGWRSIGAGFIRRSRSFRSCRSCPTPRAIPDSSSTRRRRHRCAEPVRNLVAVSGPGGAVFLRSRECRRAVSTRSRRERGDCRSRSSSASRSAYSRPRAAPRGRPASAAAGRLARPGRRRLHRRDRLQHRTVFLLGAAGSRPAALGDRHGCSPEPRGSAAGAGGCEAVARRPIRPRLIVHPFREVSLRPALRSASAASALDFLLQALKPPAHHVFTSVAYSSAASSQMKWVASIRYAVRCAAGDRGDTAR